MRIAIAANEDALTTKEKVAAALIGQGHDVMDLTRHSVMPRSLQYAEDVALAVIRQDVDRGIIVTSRCIAASFAVNRVPGIRAALCGDVQSAELGAAEDGMNILLLAAREGAIEEIVQAYLKPSLAPVHVPHGLSRRRLTMVFSHISDNLAESLTVVELAGLVGMSPFYFSKLFKVSTGLTPHRYVMRERVERARAYLIESKLELREIASRTGFETQSHFTSVFHRFTGETPKRYREKRRPPVAAEQRLARADNAAGAA